MHQPADLEAPIRPYDALRRAAFLLERSRESTYRIKAFRAAADTVAGIDEVELKGHASRGTLESLPGVGSSSAAIIREALGGGEPSYLTAARREHRPLEGVGTALYGALRGDLHMHTTDSDGGSPLAEMARTARELGQEWTAVTDHSPRLRVANGLSAERLADQVAGVDRLNAELDGAIRVLKGIEVDINADGSLDVTDDSLGLLEVVTASVHSHLRAPSLEMTPRMLKAVRHPRVNVLGHCTGRRVEGERPRPASQFNAEKVFTACAEHDVAVEINSRPERCDPPDELIELARDLGCLFAIDSDAHAPGQLDMKSLGCERAERLGIPAERIVTTWPVDEALAWARG